MKTPIVVTIAGSDSSGGAGIQADLKTFSALGVYGASVITALTAQNTLGVQGIHDVPPDFVVQQIDSVFSDLTVDAVKIGMLSQATVIEVVAEGLRRYGQHKIILDPVMVATSGDQLLMPAAVAALKERLIPLAALVTPNLPEAAVLTNTPIAADEVAMQRQADLLMQAGARAVLIKGGHGNGPESVDLLVEHTGSQRFAVPRIASRNTHGSGCTLSSAIAAQLSKGRSLQKAVADAKQYVTAAIAASEALEVGHGSGPLHHFHAWWR